MMKYFSCLLTLFSLAFSLSGQPWKPPKRLILLENHGDYTILKLAEGQKRQFYLKSDQVVTGHIAEIRTDTIVIGDIMFRAGDIREIRRESPAPPPWQPIRTKPETWYNGDTSIWTITCPPPEVYRNAMTFRKYMDSRARSLKSERNENYNPFHYRNFMKFNLVKLAHLELALAYERVLDTKISLETEVSVIFGVQGADAHYKFQYPLYNYNGFSITTYPKYFAINPRTYFGFVFMYRYLWFDQVRTGWPGNSGNSSYLQDQVRNDFGGSLRIGMMRRYDQVVIDWYVGGGLKIILLHQEIYAEYPYRDSQSMYWRHPDHSPDEVDKVLLGPVINAGIKIGFGF